MAMVTDPVCGAQFDSRDAVAQSQYQGKTYYFSATECKDRFDENPARYANHPTGDQGHANHPMGDRNTSIAGRTPDSVVGGPDYDNERMQDRTAGRNEGLKRTSLDESSYNDRTGEEQSRH